VTETDFSECAHALGIRLRQRAAECALRPQSEAMTNALQALEKLELFRINVRDAVSETPKPSAAVIFYY
jgi:hypothetical protein